MPQNIGLVGILIETLPFFNITFSGHILGFVSLLSYICGLCLAREELVFFVLES